MSFFGRLALFILIMALLIMIIGLMPGAAHSAELPGSYSAASCLPPTQLDSSCIVREGYIAIPIISNKTIQNADFINVAELTRPDQDSYGAANLFEGCSNYA